MYRRKLDLYAENTFVLYSGKLYEPPGFNSIGTFSDFTPGSRNNIFHNYDLGKMLNEPSLNGWNLQERFDFSGHGGSGPHVNYGITAPEGGYYNPFVDEKTKIDYGHHIDLF